MDFEIIKNKINQAQKIAIFTHIIPDGDAVGSACTVAHYLQSIGKEAKVYFQEQLSDEYVKLHIDDLISYQEPTDYDLIICTDCSNSERVGKYEPFVQSCDNTIAIDHHIAFDDFAANNFLSVKSSSTCEFLFDIFQALDFKIDKRMAELMYLGIIRDSGGFMYNNTTAHTHYVAEKLFDLGINHEWLNRQYMNTISLQNAMVLKYALNNLALFESNRFAISTITRKELQNIGATINDTGIVVSQILSIDSVEVAIFATEVSAGVFKVSIRSKYDIDANKIAQVFGGGGHSKASGCKVYGSREKVVELFLREVRKVIKN